MRTIAKAFALESRFLTKSTIIKELLCVVVTTVAMMTLCTTAVAESAEQRVGRVYPNWKEDYEQWNNKGLVDEYDIDMRALVVAVIEHESRFQGDVGEKYRGLMQIKLLFAIKHRLASFDIIDILL